MAKTVQLQDKIIPLSKKMCTSVLQRQRVPFASVERKEAPNSLPVSPRTGCQVKRGEKESGLGEKKAQATLSFSPLHLAAQAGRKTVWSFLSLDASKTNGQKQTNKQRRQERDALFFHLAAILLFFSSSNTESVTKRNRLVEPSWLGFE